MAKKQFKAESKRLLELMVNSIYTHKEIFLREIISNASDAIDKLCYMSLTDDGVGLTRSDYNIRVTFDKEKREISVIDNGVGMTKEDLEQNLGVIAKSGSLDFKSSAEDGQVREADIDIIGQFGVGFYSAFMVSENVKVISRAYGADAAFCWESRGADGYTVSEASKDRAGTEVIMQIKQDTEEEDYSSFLEEWQLKQLIKKYSDYVRWPIIMTDADGNDQTINSMVPIWQRPKSEVSDEECFAFYKEKMREFSDPASVLRVDAEGIVAYKAMLFIPARAPFDFYSRGYEPGLQLYSSGVMIMDRCADLLPDCFRFVRGVVDSPDLSLNISREILQHDRQLKIIANNLEKKIKAELQRLMENDREKYEEFFRSFGLSLKYGVLADYGLKKELLKDLLLFHSEREDKLITLSDYIKMMPEAQKLIYYACAETTERAKKLPQAELIRERGYDLLCLQDVDDFVMQSLDEFEGKKVCNISSDDLEIETEEEKKESEREAEVMGDLLTAVRDALGDEVAEVRFSNKLKSHAVCLTTTGEVTLEMEKYFAAMPEESARLKAQRVLELNASHQAVEALKDAVDKNPERAKKLSRILLAQATLIAGLPLSDPSDYSELVCELF